jgi:hypothetical protein
MVEGLINNELEKLGRSQSWPNLGIIPAFA